MDATRLDELVLKRIGFGVHSDFKCRSHWSLKSDVITTRYEVLELGGEVETHVAFNGRMSSL